MSQNKFYGDYFKGQSDFDQHPTEHAVTHIDDNTQTQQVQFIS